MNLLFPIETVWHREKAALTLFCISNLIVGQIGIIGGFLIAAKEATPLGRVLGQNLLSGNLYVFAVTLLVTTCTILAGEYLDAEQESQRIELKSHKVTWGVIALVLVIVQSMLTGNLIASALRVEEGLVGAPPVDSLWDVVGAGGSGQQLFLWVISMAIAVQIFCLSRMHRHPLELEQMRRKDIDKTNKQANKLDKTSDGEKL